MKIIAEAKKGFWNSFINETKCDKETAFKALEISIRKRLELRDKIDEVEIREV